MTVAELIEKLKEMPPYAEVESLWVEYYAEPQRIQFSGPLQDIYYEDDSNTVYIGEIA